VVTPEATTVYFAAQGKLWVATDVSAKAIDTLRPPPLRLTVSVLQGEGDDRVTDADGTTRAAFVNDNVLVGNEPTPVDLTDAVRAALARGETRLTVRVENPNGSQDVRLKLAGSLKTGRTGLEILPTAQGLVADLYTAEGELVAFGRSIIDLRNVEAGGYFLRSRRRSRAGHIRSPTATASAGEKARTSSWATRASIASTERAARTVSSPRASRYAISSSAKR
jgi:hypothetical protein